MNEMPITCATAYYLDTHAMKVQLYSAVILKSICFVYIVFSISSHDWPFYHRVSFPRDVEY